VSWVDVERVNEHRLMTARRGDCDSSFTRKRSDGNQGRDGSKLIASTGKQRDGNEDWDGSMRIGWRKLCVDIGRKLHLYRFTYNGDFNREPARVAML